MGTVTGPAAPPGLKMLKKSALTIGHSDDGEEGVGTCPLTLALSPDGGEGRGVALSIRAEVERGKGRGTLSAPVMGTDGCRVKVVAKILRGL